jgi:hypothetical protein
MKTKRRTITILLCIALALVAGRALLTLRWRMVHDSPLLLYVSFLMDRHEAVPYRDVFDMNMPGTYFINLILAKTLGYSDIAFRVFDLLHLFALTVVTYLWTRRIHRYVGYFSVIFLPLTYLASGPVMSLQREFLALLPFSCALAIILNRRPRRGLLQAFAVGLLWGLCALIKPYTLIGVIPIIIYLAWERRCELGRTAESPRKTGKSAGHATGHDATGDSAGRAVLACAAGVLVPLALTLIYLASAGALGHFIDIATRYLPLYSHLSGDHVPIAGAERFWYLTDRTGRGLRDAFWLAPAAGGLIILASSSHLRRFALLLGGLLLAFAIYPALSGQFWFYHWFPFTSVAAVCAGACLVPLDTGRGASRKGASAKGKPGTGTTRIGRAAPVGLVAVFTALFIMVQIRMTASDIVVWREDAPVVIRNGVPDRIAAYLRANLKPGDTVQPLDWTGGAVQGMLLAEAELATRFMYDFHFYHHIDSPYIAALRTEFLGQIRSAPPRFVIEIIRDKPWVRGANTARSFPDLSQVLKEKYWVGDKDPYFIIYVRK